MARRKTTQAVNLDFAFFTALFDFYQENRGRIQTHYRDLSKKFLAYNDPKNAHAFLRQPQYEALEVYIFLKEFLDNAPVHAIFQDWAARQGKFAGRSASAQAGQLAFMEELVKDQFDAMFRRMQANARTYPNYIYALTMGTGKTILMATCIFYEFILANKFPRDLKYCHNALVFAPDRTVLQSLKEIQTFDMRRVVPPEYANFLSTHIQFHFLEEAGTALSTLDRSRFNLIISNTQKIILKRQNKEKTAADMLFGSGQPLYQPDSVYAQNADLYAFDQPEDESDLVTNQRFEKLRRLEQLGIYIDEAHHAFGTQLARDMGMQDKNSNTSLRRTVDELAASLERAGTHVVACYNYTGTPYVGNEVLPEVIYAFGLQDAIDKGFLKLVRTNDYTNPKSEDFVDLVVDDFLRHNDKQRHEGMLPKLAFFAATIDELQTELRPAIEDALVKRGLSPSSILVNVGDEKLTSNDDIREFNRLDTPDSTKQFILLVNKGREGWNCRSLFGVALFRKPKSKIFVLQATMRCLRSIGDAQQTGRVYLSTENKQILDDELQQNFRVTVEELNSAARDHIVVEVRVRQPPEKITLRRVRRRFYLTEKPLASSWKLHLDQIDTTKYKLIHTEHDGLTSTSRTITEDLSHLRRRRTFSRLTLVADIARYLNRPCLFIEGVLDSTEEGVPGILTAVNKYNEILYDEVIPRLFRHLFDIHQEDNTEEYAVELVRTPPEGHYTVTAAPDKIVRETDPRGQGAKSFHLDTYCFDSRPEQQMFWNLLRDGKVREVYFMGMLTHGQSEFFVQYIDPESHTVRSYYPDFLVKMADGSYLIIEVKGDNKIDDPVVQAKKDFAEQLATASQMRYEMIKGSDAENGNYQFIFDPSNRPQPPVPFPLPVQ